MSKQVNSMNKGLTVKDLVTTGIFTALLFVFVLVGGVFFATNPVLTFFMPAGGGLLAGPIYLLLIAFAGDRHFFSDASAPQEPDAGKPHVRFCEGRTL